MKNSFTNYLTFFLLGIIFLFLQTSSFGELPFISLSFNFLMAAGICVGIYFGIYQTLFIVSYFGLLIDSWFNSPSFYTLSMVTIIIIICRISNQISVSHIYVLVATATGTAFIELINAALLGFFYYGLDSNPFDFEIFKSKILYLILGNCIFANFFSWYIKKKSKEVESFFSF